jgi:DUF1680 family protein
MKVVSKVQFIIVLFISVVIAVAGTAFAQQIVSGISSAAEQPAQTGPPLTAIAGVDRVVIQQGKTYLNGYAGYGSPRVTRQGGLRRGIVETDISTAAAANPAPKVTWSKESGPGAVIFENANTAITTATFSAPGLYLLKLTAENGQTSVSSSLKVTVEQPAPARHLETVYTKPYKINNPLWNSTVKALIVSWIPHCIDEISNPQLREGGISNFIEAAKKLAGQDAGRHIGYPFSNAWVFNTIESMCNALMIDAQADAEIIKAQEKMKTTLEDWIPKILAAQEPDGYLQTRFTLGTANDRGPAQHWDTRTRGEHEGYVAGYFLEAAIVHYIMTNKTDSRLYNAARKLADCWYDNIGPAPKKQWYDGHQEMEQALVRFGRFVNDTEGKGKGDKYIELAKFLLDCRRGGSEYDQSHLPVIKQYEAVGHAVRASYSYSGMADIAVETGDIDYQSAVKSIWDNIVNRKYYITGGVGSGETSEGFGPNYSLRNNAYCESCSSCGEIFFQYKMNLLYQDARYADLYEETLYNAVLGSIDLQGKNFYYQNPLTGGRARYAWHNCPCCVGNIPRVLLMLPTWTYVKSADSIYINLFIASTMKVENVAGTDVELTQATDYPWNGKVSIAVNPASQKNFSIKIRVPNRNVSSLYSSAPNSDGITSISVNGMAITPAIEKGYAIITRDWQAGDKIDMVLPMKVQRVTADEKISADAGRVALRYGPLIYNIESADQNIDLVLKPTAALTTQFRPDLLGGVMTIKGAFEDGSAMTAIPNYARNNRFDSSSAAGNSIVWIKAQ